MTSIISTVLLSVTLLLVACENQPSTDLAEASAEEADTLSPQATTAKAEEDKESPKQPISKPIQCQEPRPEMCTMHFDPVCGTLKKGGEKTFGNGCSACGSPEVMSYVPGACGEPHPDV